MRTIGWVTCFHLGRSADRCYIHSLAVDYCFLANDGLEVHPELVVESFDAKTEQNDYEVHTLVCIGWNLLHFLPYIYRSHGRYET